MVEPQTTGARAVIRRGLAGPPRVVERAACAARSPRPPHQNRARTAPHPGQHALKATRVLRFTPGTIAGQPGEDPGRAADPVEPLIGGCERGAEAGFRVLYYWAQHV